MRSPRRAEGQNVLPDPPVRVFLVDFSDYAMTYEVKFYMGNHSRINETNDSMRTKCVVQLKRQGITIPFPIRTLHVERKKVHPRTKSRRRHSPFCAENDSLTVFPKTNSTRWSTRRASNFSVVANR